MSLDLVRTVRERLAEYLTAEFAAGSDGVETLAEWPAPGADLPEKAVTIVIPEGTEPEVTCWPPAEFAFIPDPVDTTRGTTQYSYGKFKLPLQLDVWARYPEARSAIVRRLGTLLFRHPNETLANDTWPRLSRWPELVLRVPSLPGFLLYYRFQDIPVPEEGGTSAQEGEYRATLRGRVEGLLTTEESVALLRTLTIELDVTDGSTPLGAGETETLTITGL